MKQSKNVQGSQLSHSPEKERGSSKLDGSRSPATQVEFAEIGLSAAKDGQSAVVSHP